MDSRPSAACIKHDRIHIFFLLHPWQPCPDNCGRSSGALNDKVLIEVWGEVKMDDRSMICVVKLADEQYEAYGAYDSHQGYESTFHLVEWGYRLSCIHEGLEEWEGGLGIGAKWPELRLIFLIT